MQKKLTVIAESQAAGRSMIQPANGPAFKSGGPDDFLCGACGTVVAEGMGGGIKLQSMVIRCYRCGAFNEVTGA